MKTIEGQLNASGLRFGIVLGRFNNLLGEKLLQGAQDCLQRHGAGEDDLTVIRVPGSFEVTQAARRLATSGKFSAVIALGVLIRGGTIHYDLLCNEVTRGLMNAGIDTGVPVTFGIVTGDTLEQAMERCGTKQGNKGWDAALAAIELCNVYQGLEEGS
jgi:6,7-dimethyl-8-ribityllumazine synthase